MPTLNNTAQPSRRKYLLLALVAIILFGAAYFIWQSLATAPREAPEAARVMDVQAGAPFQILIPAYLPRDFDRAALKIESGLPAPDGEPMVQLTYPAANGEYLILKEWIRKEQPDPNEVVNMYTRSVGPLFVSVELSRSKLMTLEQVQTMLDTLAPATNLTVFSEMTQVPLTYALPEAVEVPLNAEGVQEVVLVVDVKQYTPAHFAVKKGVPTRLVFRQLGEVGCGNELIFQYGTDKETTLLLASPSDKQIFEFTPDQTGDFPFNCPHYYYRGVITVQD